MKRQIGLRDDYPRHFVAWAPPKEAVGRESSCETSRQYPKRNMDRFTDPPAQDNSLYYVSLACVSTEAATNPRCRRVWHGVYLLRRTSPRSSFVSYIQLTPPPLLGLPVNPARKVWVHRRLLPGRLPGCHVYRLAREYRGGRGPSRRRCRPHVPLLLHTGACGVVCGPCKLANIPLLPTFLLGRNTYLSLSRARAHLLVGEIRTIAIHVPLYHRERSVQYF